MKQAYQTVLLVDHVADAIDSIIDVCNAAELPPIKVSTAFNAQYAEELLAENDFSLLVCGLSDSLTLDDIAELSKLHAPKPILVLLAERSYEQVICALRKGASDVFVQGDLDGQAEEFSKSIRKLLLQADLIEKKQHYQEELEKSLSELQADQQAALQVQQNMLPRNEVRLGDVLARYILVPSLYLSGDFVDVVQIDEDRTLFYLADVSGHGASSALVTVLLKNMTNRLLRNFRRRSSFDILSPIDVLYRINSEILDTELGKHLSIFIGLYDAKQSELVYAVGGHHPMPVLFEAGSASFLEGRGMPVGLFPEPMFEERKLLLSEVFEITLFSDGILEMMSEPNMQAKEERLLEAVIAADGKGPEAIKASVLPGVVSAAPDDIAIMTICRQ